LDLVPDWKKKEKRKKFKKRRTHGVNDASSDDENVIVAKNSCICCLRLKQNKKLQLQTTFSAVYVSACLIFRVWGGGAVAAV